MSDSLDVNKGRVVALSGGIGGAKLALGLYRVLAPGHLTVLCNPGDDFEHLGLTVCPDFDTVLYTLSDLANPELGWGRREETWTFMRALEALGGETWFNLGDGDLAVHVERSRRLAAGGTPTEVARHLSARLGIEADLLPPCDTPVRTVVDTVEHGPLPFQRYFVERRCGPTVTGFRFDGAHQARISHAARAALEDTDLAAVVICPSNPFISIDPMLAIPGVRDALRAAPAPVIAVSPLIGGHAVKGPTAKMMDELAIPRTNAALAEHYGDWVDGWVVDAGDADDFETMARPGRAVPTMMSDEASKIRLAGELMALARDLLAR